MESECHKNEQVYHKVLEKTQTKKLIWQHVTFQHLSNKVKSMLLKNCSGAVR